MSQKQKKVRIRQLEGRVIESAVLWPADPSGRSDRTEGPGLELRLAGGLSFVFTAVLPHPTPSLEIIMGRDVKGDYEILVERVYGIDSDKDETA